LVVKKMHNAILHVALYTTMFDKCERTFNSSSGALNSSSRTTKLPRGV
jgi:hypothetical protein